MSPILSLILDSARNMQSLVVGNNLAFSIIDMNSYDCHKNTLQEKNFIKNTSTERQQAFLTGRSALRTAAGMLGVNLNDSILQDFNKAPIVPNNITVSISHSKNYAISLVGKSQSWAGVGIDIEFFDKNRFNKKLLSRIEKNWHLVKDTSEDIAKTISSKESLVKLIYMASGMKILLSNLELQSNIDDSYVFLCKADNKLYNANAGFTYINGGLFVISIVVVNS